MLQLYKNIKNKRTELKMTQSELASKLGYADKSMIAKIEKGLVDLTQSKIIAFAEALNTTPSELMGWEYLSDEEIGEALYNNMIQDVYQQMRAVFSKDEVVHFEDYVQLNLKNKRTVNKYTKQLLELQRMDDALYADAASKRTDIDIPEDADTSDDDVFKDF